VNALTTDRSIHAVDSEVRVDWRDRSLSRCARAARLLERRANTYKDFLKLILESMSRKGLPFSTSRKFACKTRAYRRA